MALTYIFFLQHNWLIYAEVSEDLTVVINGFTAGSWQ
jgi:hypothetical protein